MRVPIEITLQIELTSSTDSITLRKGSELRAEVSRALTRSLPPGSDVDCVANDAQIDVLCTAISKHIWLAMRQQKAMRKPLDGDEARKLAQRYEQTWQKYAPKRVSTEGGEAPLSTIRFSQAYDALVRNGNGKLFDKVLDKESAMQKAVLNLSIHKDDEVRALAERCVKSRHFY